MPSKVRHVGISESPLSVDRALSLVSGSAVGGIGLFVGTVRDSDHGAGVVSLDYTQHPSAIDVLTKCAEETADHHDVLAIAVEQGEKLPSGGYDVVHGTAVLGIDGKDEVPIVWTEGTSPAQFASDIHQLLDS